MLFNARLEEIQGLSTAIHWLRILLRKGEDFGEYDDPH
jgi:hypothetical protein